MVTNRILCNRPQSSTPEASELVVVLASERANRECFLLLFSYFPLCLFVFVTISYVL